MVQSLTPWRYFLATLLLLLPQLLSAQSTPKAEIRIGFNYPQSGPYARIGMAQYQGAMLAADEINAQGGILNAQVLLVTRDSGSHVRKTEGNIKELLESENVRMIFGGVSSAIAITSCELCQEKWVPFFGTLTYSTATTGEAAHRACFRESYNSWMAAKLLANYMKQHFSGQRFFYITADYTYGWTTEQSIRELTNTTDPQRHPGIRTPFGTTNYVKVLQQVKASNPDVLILTLGGADLTAALRQATVMGLKDRSKIVVSNLLGSDIVNSGPHAMEGVIGTMPWFWKIPYIYAYPRGVGFVERFKARYHDYPTGAAASAYTILFEYKSAVERAGSFDGPAVIRALEGHQYQIVKDPQTWRVFDHQSIQTVYLVRGLPITAKAEDAADKYPIELLDSMAGQVAARSHEEWLAVRRKAGKADTLEPLTEKQGQ